MDPRGTALGVRAPGVFASEFGVSVFSSYESMAPTLSTAGQIAHSAEMFQRNYCADSIIDVYFGVAPYNQTKSSPQNFQVSAIRLSQRQALSVF